MADELIPSKVIDFDPALEWNGKRLESIELSEPRILDLVNAEREGGGSVTKYGVALLASMTGQPRQVIEKMPMRKFTEAVEYAMAFINGGQATGES